jgi:uncharacterized protein
MLLVIDRASASGQSAARVHYSRMLVLLLFGLLHFYVIWHGDILVSYALTGMVAFAFRNRTTKRMLRWGIGLMLLSLLMFGSMTFGMVQADRAAHRPGATAKQITQWNDIASFAVRPAADNAIETRMAHADVVTRSRHMVTARGGEPFSSAFAFMPTTLALMLFGMAGYRSGFLTGEWDDRRYRRIAGWSLGLGSMAMLGLGLWVISSNFYVPVISLGMLVLGQPVQLAMAFGYAALLVLLSRRQGAIAQRFAAVGRAAFSNYLGTSILAALIFYGDGLDLFGTLSRFQAWLLVPLFWLGMLAWSKPWLDRFHYGPLEWLWRSLARGELQPMRKRLPGSALAAEA